MLTRALVFFKDYSTQGSFKKGLDTIASVKRSPITPIQPRKAIIEKARNMSKLLRLESLVILCRRILEMQ